MSLCADVTNKLEDKSRADEVKFLIQQIETTLAVLNGCLNFSDQDLNGAESYLKEAHARVDFIKKLNDEDTVFLNSTKLKINTPKSSFSLDNGKIHARFDLLALKPELEVEQKNMIKGKLEKLEQELQQAESDCFESEQELKTIEEELDTLQLQIDQENLAIEDTRTQENHMEDKIAELETNIEEVIAQDTLLDDAIEELSWHKRFKESEDLYMELLQEHDNMEMEVQKDEDYGARLSNEIEESRIELEMLKEQVNKQRSEMASSIPARPIFVQPQVPAMKFFNKPNPVPAMSERKPILVVPEKKIAIQPVPTKNEQKSVLQSQNNPKQLPFDETMETDMDQSIWGTDF
uniref:Uncharacterized protein n=1 Tax=Acrobeloides nanus TaxID=290746 RepID=A0A914C679_9BILA